jgi:hypothetical protein
MMWQLRRDKYEARVEWPSPFQASAYHQVRITVTSDGIAVVVRGAKGMTDEFREVDRFTIPLQ